MDDSASAWSGLGSTMSLPSTVRDEIQKLALDLRDLKLELTRDLMETREAILAVAEQLDILVEKQKSLITRVEGLEVRAHNVTPSNRDEFNAFAYVDLSELEDQPDESELIPVAGFEYEAPEEIVSNDSPVEAEEVPSNELNESEEFLAKLKVYLVEHDEVMNNMMYYKVLGARPNFDDKTKAAIKKGINDDPYFATEKVDKFRTRIFVAKEGSSSEN